MGTVLLQKSVKTKHVYAGSDEGVPVRPQIRRVRIFDYVCVQRNQRRSNGESLLAFLRSLLQIANGTGMTTTSVDTD